jgi:hypothetical protein
MCENIGINAYSHSLQPVVRLRQPERFVKGMCKKTKN